MIFINLNECLIWVKNDFCHKLLHQSDLFLLTNSSSMINSLISCILVPIDYSPVSRQAAHAAAYLAKQLGADLFILHTYSLPVVGLAEGIVIADEIRQAQDKKLADFVEEFRTEYPQVSVRGELQFGGAADWIVTKAEELTIDFIVMGTQGASDGFNSFFGSITSHIIGRVKCPVLIIPKGCHLRTINEVIFASDFHPTNDMAVYLKPLISLIEEFDPFVHVVHFGHQQETPLTAAEIESAKLHELFKETKYSFHTLEADFPEEALFAFAEKYHGDLIVAVTRHYSLWERIFHRSFTKNIALHTTTPLLILHENAAEDLAQQVRKKIG